MAAAVMLTVALGGGGGGSPLCSRVTFFIFECAAKLWFLLSKTHCPVARDHPFFRKKGFHGPDK